MIEIFRCLKNDLVNTDFKGKQSRVIYSAEIRYFDLIILKCNIHRNDKLSYKFITPIAAYQIAYVSLVKLIYNSDTNKFCLT